MGACYNIYQSWRLWTAHFFVPFFILKDLLKHLYYGQSESASHIF